MCSKKISYAAGDDLLLYATPKEALEDPRRKQGANNNSHNYRASRSGDGSNGNSFNRHRNTRSYDHYDNERVSSPSMRKTSSPVVIPGNFESQQAYQNQLRRTEATQHQQRQQQQQNAASYAHGGGQIKSSSVINGRPVPPQSSAPQMLGANSPPIRATIPRQDSATRLQGYSHQQQYSQQSQKSPHMVPRPRNPQGVSSDERDIAIATQLFQAHDVRRKGRLTTEELQNLLQNDDNSRFCISSIDSLINLFGAARFGTINLNEFISLYKRVKMWRKVYVDNDINGSHTLSLNEFHNSLLELGYVIPVEVTEKLFDQYAEFNAHLNLNAKELKFDRFVESLVWLLQLTKNFRKYDLEQEGIATIQYKDFIEITLLLGRLLPR